MTTNNLFREVLDGRIPTADPFDHHAFNRAVNDVARVSEWAYQYAADLLMRFAKDCPDIDHIHVSIGGDWDAKPTPPADPRARALAAQQNRNTGPAATPLRVRGRNTHYKEKA